MDIFKKLKNKISRKKKDIVEKYKKNFELKDYNLSQDKKGIKIRGKSPFVMFDTSFKEAEL